MFPDQDLIPDLFRQEFSKMVAVISKVYGLQHIEIAEDIVSETFLQATEDWQRKGTPANPSAWLYAVAKQKVLYRFRRNKIYEEKVIPHLTAANEIPVTVDDINFSEQSIKDSQLQMMFAVCNPVIVSEAQIGLALRILCGFSIGEIAEAFLTHKETINKRLYRAKEKLRQAKIKLRFPSGREAADRLDNVLHIIYLLFNEGYYSATQQRALRKEFCYEALRLALILTGYRQTNQPRTHALIALMCFHASRFDARQAEGDLLILYEEQDRRLWDKALISKGAYHLELAASGGQISSYHLEAGIAFWHCQVDETAEKWPDILQHYDLLLQINNSPVVALNRAYAVYKAKGKAAALREVESLPPVENQFYYTLLGELYKGTDNPRALACFGQALTLAKTATDQRLLRARMEELKK